MPQLDVDDLAQVFARQRVEYDDIVNAVQELGPEVLAQRIQQALARIGVARVLAVHRESDGVLLHHAGADVGGHHDHGVLEADRAALAIGEAAIVENLQQHVEDVGMRLFDFVEEHHRIRPAAHLFGELAALFVADVSGRRADHAGDGVLLHVLGHVDADHGLVVVEQVLRQRAHQFGFADAGGAEEDEAADGPVGVAEAGAVAQDGVGDQAHGFVLADHAVFEALGHLHQLLDFAFHHAGDRDAGPLGDDAGDIVFADLFFEQGVLLDGFEFLLGGLDILLDLREAAVAELRGLFPIAGAAGLLFFLAQLLLLFLELADAADGGLFAVPALLERGGLAAQTFRARSRRSAGARGSWSRSLC